MGDIVKGLLSTGIALVAGWIVPSAASLLLFATLVLPSLSVPWANLVAAPVSLNSAAWWAGFSAVAGLVLNMLQTPLYRILEGYLAWPQALFISRKRYHQKRKRKIRDRLELIKAYREALATAVAAQPPDRLDVKVAEVRLREEFRRMRKKDQQRSAPQRALLREILRRYPVEDEQMLPTLLGNAIRRFEEYGWNRYKLDSQTLWTRLMGTAPEAVRKQVDTSQVGVDFFVCLLYGNLLIALTACGALLAHRPRTIDLLIALVLPLVLMPVWYRLAVYMTDQWSAAVQALVDLGRRPLAAGMGLIVPTTLDQEREMWEAVSRFARREYDTGASDALDRFRAPGELK